MLWIPMTASNESSHHHEASIATLRRSNSQNTPAPQITTAPMIPVSASRWKTRLCAWLKSPRSAVPKLDAWLKK